MNLTLSETGERRKDDEDAPLPDRATQWHSLKQLIDHAEQGLAGHAGWLLAGQPGGGKTTLLQHHEATMARLGLQQLESGEAPADSTNAATRRARFDAPHELCLWFRMQDYGAAVPDVEAWLVQQWARRYPTMPDLKTLLGRYRVRFLFDGLNEIDAGTADERATAVSALVAWAARARGDNRILAPIFSVREYHLGTLGADAMVKTIHVQRWGDEQIARYVAKALRTDADVLWARIRHDERLKALCSVPINLNSQCVLFGAGGFIGDSAAALFSGMVWLRLQRELTDVGRFRHTPLRNPALLSPGELQRIKHPGFWRDAREHPQRVLRLPSEGGLLPTLQAQALTQLRQRLDGNQKLVVDVSTVATELVGAERDDWLRAVRDLGLAEVDLNGQFRFPHQLWLEYWAARAIAGPADGKAGAAAAAKPKGLVAHWAARLRSFLAGRRLWIPASAKPPKPPPLADALAAAAEANEALPMIERSKWEEVLKMAVQLAAEPAPLLRRLIAVAPALAGRAAVARRSDERCAELVDKLRHRLHRLSTDPRVDLRLRVEAGLALGDLGDTIRYRRGVGLHGEYLVPADDRWVEIRAKDNRCTIGSAADDDEAFDDEKPPINVTLKPYRMAWAPVTNAEWGCFMRAGGYDNEAFWQRAGADSMKWRRDTDRRQPRMWNNGEYNNPAQPVIGVCLWEAMAYCEWLTQQHKPDDRMHRLPTEAEWEFAARGVERHRYPWGDEPPSHEHCNFDGTHLWRTSPVGVFPAGDRQLANGRLSDLAGNVDEWTCSRFTRRLDGKALTTPASAADGNEVRRALRGGRFNDTARYVRGASRNDFDPLVVSADIGFRVVSCPIEFPVP